MSKRNQEVVRVVRPDQASKTGIAAGVAALAGAAAGLGASRKFSKSPAVEQSASPSKQGDRQTPDTPEKESGPVGPFDLQNAGVEPGKENGVKGKIMKFAEKHRWRWLGRTMQILNRYTEVQGNNLAAAVTLQTFLALFPLLIIASSVAGFLVGNDPDVPRKIVEKLGVTNASTQQTITEAIQGTQGKAGWAAAIGFVALLWSALGVSAALEYAYNQAWQTSGRGVKDKAVGLAWMIGAAILFAGSALVTSLIRFVPTGLGLLTIVAGIAVTFLLWIFTGWVLPNVKVPWKAVIPGAIVGTVGLQAIQYLTGLLPGAVGGADNGAYGAFGAALGIIAALFIFGRIVVASAVTNVVFWEAKHGTAKATIELPTASAPTSAGITRSGQTDK